VSVDGVAKSLGSKGRDRDEQKLVEFVEGETRKLDKTASQWERKARLPKIDQQLVALGESRRLQIARVEWEKKKGLQLLPIIRHLRLVTNLA
jgi:hypothetical protein